MATLTGTQVKNTYQSLLKFSSNGSLDPYFSTVVSDGLGNDTPLMLSGAEFATQIPSSSKPYGFWAQLFSNGNVSIGDYSNQFNGTWIGMNDFSQLIGTYSNNLAKGLKIDFPNKAYNFGDFNSVDNGTSILVDDANENITLKANTSLTLTGTDLTSTVAGSTNSLHLRVKINGVFYKIQLRNDTP